MMAVLVPHFCGFSARCSNLCRNGRFQHNFGGTYWMNSPRASEKRLTLTLLHYVMRKCSCVIDSDVSRCTKWHCFHVFHNSSANDDRLEPNRRQKSSDVELLEGNTEPDPERNLKFKRQERRINSSIPVSAKAKFQECAI